MIGYSRRVGVDKNERLPGVRGPSDCADIRCLLDNQMPLRSLFYLLHGDGNDLSHQQTALRLSMGYGAQEIGGTLCTGVKKKMLHQLLIIRRQKGKRVPHQIPLLISDTTAVMKLLSVSTPLRHSMCLDQRCQVR